MAPPLVGKTEFRTTAGKTILVVDPDSSFVQMILQSTTSPPFTIVELTNTGSLSLLGGRARLDGTLGNLWLQNNASKTIFLLEAKTGNLYVGGNGQNGDVLLFRGNTSDMNPKKASVHLDAANANVFVGGNGAKGDVLVFPENAPDNTDGANATVVLSGSAAGRITVRTVGSFGVGTEDCIVLEGGPLLGGRINVRGVGEDEQGFPVSSDAIVLDGKTGDITLANADSAEDFEVANFDQATPGTLMALAKDGRLSPTSLAYDTKVAGIVSGAGTLKPGIVLGRSADGTDRRPIALAGRVNCKVDAGYGPIEVGDLLTSSATTGHAMKVLDHQAAFGAVVGKALAPLAHGEALLPVLVTLQ